VSCRAGRRAFQMRGPDGQRKSGGPLGPPLVNAIQRQRTITLCHIAWSAGAVSPHASSGRRFGQVARSGAPASRPPSRRGTPDRRGPGTRRGHPAKGRAKTRRASHAPPRPWSNRPDRRPAPHRSASYRPSTTPRHCLGARRIEEPEPIGQFDLTPPPLIREQAPNRGGASRTDHDKLRG
jgi:hypothetical protein